MYCRSLNVSKSNSVGPTRAPVGATFSVTIGGDDARPSEVDGADVKDFRWFFVLKCPNFTIIDGPKIDNKGTG